MQCSEILKTPSVPLWPAFKFYIQYFKMCRESGDETDCGGAVLLGFCLHNIQRRGWEERKAVHQLTTYRNPNLSLDGNVWTFGIGHKDIFWWAELFFSPDNLEICNPRVRFQSPKSIEGFLATVIKYGIIHLFILLANVYGALTENCLRCCRSNGD